MPQEKLVPSTTLVIKVARVVRRGFSRQYETPSVRAEVEVVVEAEVVVVAEEEEATQEVPAEERVKPERQRKVQVFVSLSQ